MYLSVDSEFEQAIHAKVPLSLNVLVASRAKTRVNFLLPLLVLKHAEVGCDSTSEAYRVCVGLP